MLNSVSLKENMEDALDSYKNLPISIEFFAKIGEKPKINIFYKNEKVTYCSDTILQQAKKISISEEDIKENLSRFNDEIFKPESIKISMDADVFIRKKDINECRRQAVDLLKDKLAD